MEVIYHKGSNDQSIVVLHGTGSQASDLFPLAQLLDPKAHLIGVNGDVFEHGMRRYFERYADGQFNLESLKEQTDVLYRTIEDTLNQYQLKSSKVTIIGYSNGANIAISVLKSYSTQYNKAVLLHPMNVRSTDVLYNQPNLSVFMSYGEHDSYVSEKDFDLLSLEMRKNIQLSVLKHNNGHQITAQEVNEIKRWFD